MLVLLELFLVLYYANKTDAEKRRKHYEIRVNQKLEKAELELKQKS